MVGGSGGAHITIQGNSFDPFPGNTEVTVGSAPCPLVKVTDTELVCAAPAQEEMAGTELGTRGLLHELWNNTEIEVTNFKHGHSKKQKKNRVVYRVAAQLKIS